MIIDNRLQPLLTSAFLPTSAPSRVRLFPARWIAPSFSPSRTLDYRRVPRLAHLHLGNRFLKLTPRRNFRLVELRLQKGSWINAFGLSRVCAPPSFSLPHDFVQGLRFFSAPFSLARRVWEFSWIHFFENATPRESNIPSWPALLFPGRPLFRHVRAWKK